MPVRFLVNGSTSPFTLPGDWTDAGHTVRLIGCGGRGGTASTGVNHRSGPGGGGGAHVLLTRTAGTLASTPFFVGVDNPSTTVKTTSIATMWGSATFLNCRYVEAGEGGGAGGTDTAGGLGGVATTTSTGTPTVPTYTASLGTNGGAGGAVAAVTASGGGGGGAGGPSAAGGVGGSSATTSFGGGGGGGGNSGAGSNATNSNGGPGGFFPNGGGAGGTSGTPAGGNGTINTGTGGGGGFFSTVTAANTHGGDGAVDDLFTQTVPATVTGGPGGGGGGGGGNSVNTPTPITSGGNGAFFGGGGGGAGGTRSATSTRTAGTGASGLIVITYTQLVVTGTVAVTEPRDTAVFTGSIAAAVNLTATSLIGTAPSLLAVPLFDVSDESSGTLVASDPSDIAEFTGTLALNAILAVTEPPDTAAATGSVTWFGELASTEPSDTAELLGLVSLTGTLDVTEPSDTALFIEGIFGPLEVTEPSDTAVFLGTPVDNLTATDLVAPEPELLAVPAFGVTANFLAVTEPSDNAALTGLVGAPGILSVTEASDTAALTGTTVWNAVLAVIEPSDTAAILGTTIAVVSLEATSLVMDAPELLALPVFDAAAEFFITGTLDVTEASDTAAILGSTEAVSSLAATNLISDEPELLAVPAFGFITVVSGALAVTEAPDVAAITGTNTPLRLLTGNGLVSDAPELLARPAFVAIAEFDIQSATIGPPLLGRPALVDTKTGILAVTETSDTAAFTGSLIAGPDLITVNAASVLFTGSTINLVELVGDAIFVGAASVVFTGQTVGLIDQEVLPVTPASVLLAGQTVIVREGDTFPVTNATVTFTGKTVGTFEGDVIPVANAAVTFTGQDIFIDIQPGHILFSGQEVLVRDTGLILGGGVTVPPWRDYGRKKRRRFRALEEIERRLDKRIETLKAETKKTQEKVAEVLSTPAQLLINEQGFEQLLAQQMAITQALLEAQRRAEAVRQEKIELAALAERAARRIDDEEAMAVLSIEPDASAFNAAMARFIEMLPRMMQ